MSGSVIGVDPSVDHPAVAIWPEGKTWQLRTRGEGAARLLNLYAAIHDWAALSAPDDLLAVFIERPTGRFADPALTQANGVIQVAVLHGLNEQFPHPVSCFEISPGTWKLQAIGSGRAKKDDVAQWAMENLDPATTKDFTQDEADALAIACAGYKLLSTEREDSEDGN